MQGKRPPPRSGPAMRLGNAASGMSVEFSVLHTGEVFRPAVAAPTLHGHRWASAVLTSDLTQNPGFPATEFGAGGMEDPSGMEEGAPPAELLFPPPPPPMLPSSVSNAVKEQRMMRWYQVCEAWCVERVQDNQRVIVAPPPRPPPFTQLDVVSTFLPHQPQIGLAPYSLDQWIPMTRHWWAHCARHFDKLRGPKYEGHAHVSTAQAVRLTGAEVLACVASGGGSAERSTFVVVAQPRPSGSATWGHPVG